MNDKDKIDALLKLLDSHLRHLIQTREIEFKVRKKSDEQNLS